MYGQLAGELGILGLLAWGFMIWYTIHGAREIRRLEDLKHGEGGRTFTSAVAQGIEISIYARLVLGMTTHSLHILFWYFCAGLIICMQRIQAEEDEPDEEPVVRWGGQ